MNAPGAHILAIGTAVPAHRGSKDDSVHFFSEVLKERAPPADRAKLLRYLELVSARSGISTRYTVLPDYLQADPGGFEFFPRNWSLEPLPSTARRMAVYRAESPKLARLAAEDAFSKCGVLHSEVTHLIVTTCTGFFAPGLDLALVDALALSPRVARTVIGFMGCQAGLNGLRTADQIIRADPTAVVLQLSVELCTLHLQADPSPSVLVANCLFGDGAAAVICGGGRHEGAHARVLGQVSAVEPSGQDDMTWNIGDHGFTMYLDARIPQSLAPVAKETVSLLLEQNTVPRDRVRRFAVHPGGPRVIDAVERSLGLSKPVLESARGVLRDFGNMSSASIFFVLAREIERRIEPGPLVALAFGPGLTVEAALLELL